MINIIGAGLGGLALAQGLRARGLSCTVYERDADAGGREQGYRISLNPLGRAALQELLPAKRFARVLALECRGVGRSFAFARQPERALLRLDSDAWTVCRPALRALLLEDVPVVWGARISRLGELPPAELTVAADGVGSLLREELRGHAPVPALVDTGVRTRAGLALRAEWDARLPLNRDGAVQYLGPRGQALFVSHCEREDGTPVTLWALSQRSAQPPLPDADWHPTLAALMRAGEPAAELQSIRSTRVAVPRARLHPRLTLLGDAAHAMPPYRGLGGNHAFEDARQLCQRLDDVAGYEREMLTRGKRAVAESDEALQMLHFANPVARWVRDTALRVAARLS